jgi:L-rhamnose isomerase
MSRTRSRKVSHASRAYQEAKAYYTTLDVDSERAIAETLQTPLSLHGWQADDVRGFEVRDGAVDGGGILATGQYPGRARNGDEIRRDLTEVLRLAPGAHRVNLHAIYAETEGRKVERDALEPAHFERWITWARAQGVGLDFNTTFFAHPMANDGWTLSHPDRKVREFWIRHGRAGRRIATAMGRALRSPCVLNHWLPDGVKDSPADRWSPRRRLMESLDRLLAPETGVDPRWCRDAVEGKLFGIGSEDYVVGSMEFYSAYALTRKVILCLDMGHFHPTETIHDKLSALLLFHPMLLLHLSRPIRWDSDHVVVFNDDLRAVFHELARGKVLRRVLLATDYFDASINRICAYVIGARAVRKALLFALLEPVERLQRLEAEGRGGEKLAWMEETKSGPFAAVWDELCRRAGAPRGTEWIERARAYEEEVLTKRE